MERNGKWGYRLLPCCLHWKKETEWMLKLRTVYLSVWIK